ncbi:class I SAM-dependent methyltransferase [Calothrix sp. PCC 7507]|uniref:class I SAM-dependent methyltransferase n=1 Tax=Calothrix sp. PCC 7507 TaxID=99598 RepID=UPI0003155F3A|nr:class I SAM-dependent methyltransferase [Calothrix sp. PCC 7507]
MIARKFEHPDVKDFIDTYYENRVDWQILADEIFEIIKCQNCTFIWQKYILDSIGLSKLYSEWISSEQSLAKKQCANMQLYSKYAKQIQYINSFFPERKPREIKVLDYGCGWGYWCLMAKAHGYEVMGVEISEQRVQFAKNNSLNIVYSLSEISGKQFDFINSQQSFEHIPNPLENLRYLVKTLSHGGIIRISVPNGKKIEKELKSPQWKAKKDAIHPLEHINCFTPRSLIYMAEEAGLKLMHDKYQQQIEFKEQLKEFIKTFWGRFDLDSIGTSLYFIKLI